MIISDSTAIQLLPQEINHYHEQGYLIIPDYVSDQVIQGLVERAEQMVAEFEIQDISIFSTKNQNEHTDNYFLNSSYQSCCFFEEGAFDDEGNLTVPKSLAINKIGHAMHDLDAVFQAFSYQTSLASITKALGYRQPSLLQSMYIFKQPRIGGEVIPHQDSTFLYTDPPSCMSFWVALEDATVQNGCLTGIPQSHKKYPNHLRWVRSKDGKQMQFIGKQTEWNLQEFIPLEVEKGTLIIFDGNFAHSSEENQSEKSRHAYTMHLIETDGVHYPNDNWLIRPENFPLLTLEQAFNQC